jgi:hypothetical protein
LEGKGVSVSASLCNLFFGGIFLRETVLKEGRVVFFLAGKPEARRRDRGGGSSCLEWLKSHLPRAWADRDVNTLGTANENTLVCSRGSEATAHARYLFSHSQSHVGC